MVKADFLMRAKSGISFMSAPGVFQVFFYRFLRLVNMNLLGGTAEKNPMYRGGLGTFLKSASTGIIQG